jgi:hypothetical protein
MIAPREVEDGSYTLKEVVVSAIWKTLVVQGCARTAIVSTLN